MNQMEPRQDSSTRPLAVVILNWNDAEATLSAVEAASSTSDRPDLIVVVDNGSSDADASKLEIGLSDQGKTTVLDGSLDTISPELQSCGSGSQVLIRSRANLGFTGGSNLGVQAALKLDPTLKTVVLLNNDARPQDGAFAELQWGSRLQDVGVVGATLYDPATSRMRATRFQKTWPLFFRIPRTVDGSEELPRAWLAPVASGACLLLTRNLVDDLLDRDGQILSEDLFLYLDELDLCCRAREMGYETVICRDAIVEHDGIQPSDGPAAERRFHYYFNRNRVIMAKRLLSPFAMPLFHLANAGLVSIRATRFLIQERPDLALQAIAGTFDGLRGEVGKRSELH